jgi:hypothetical protein
MAMTLMDYVTGRSGSWTSQAQASANVIELTQYDDAVVFQGPLSLNVAVVAEAVLVPVAGGNSRSSVNDLYSYDVEVPAGYTWRYQMSDSPAGQRVSGFKVVIRPAPCPPRTPVQAPDLPCEFAVCNLTNVGEFFPIACEPCGSGPVRLPPTCGPSLAVMPAAGGCVRPRFFNGMFITREDLETQLRYLRIKNQLQRRADGEGVVWGLGLGRDGGAVCVQPGYAVDCCGNDLIVTSPYKVDSATLLSDPAVCNLLTGNQQCMSLLLEYMECPEQPRPVHGGDPCSGAAAGCEMSRVRETVRLRLVPTRDYQPSGPIQRFLNTISQGAPAAQGGGQTAPASTVTSPSTIPFQISVICPTAGGQITLFGGGTTSTVILQPSTNDKVMQQFTLTGSSILTITMPAAQYLMSGGTVETTSSNPAGVMPATNIVLPGPGTNRPISWQLDAAQPSGSFQLLEAVYTVQSWTAPAGPEAPGGTYSGTTIITVTAQRESGVPGLIVAFQVAVAATPITLTTPPPAPFPCLTDPCCTSTPLFPVSFPWADANPFNPSQEGDLGVILLGVLYILLEGAIVQKSPNTNLYLGLYYGVARLVDPNVTAGTLDAFSLNVQQLLTDLCCSLLYPGPVCHGQPHGVVIGCAAISGGEIERVDPWSGRRWVMHYPLWSYWSSKFGLVPPDVLASRIFSFICCIAGLKAPVYSSGQAPAPPPPPVAVPVGSGRIIVNPAATEAASETLSLPLFAARTLSALSTTAAPPGTPMTEIALEGNPAIRLEVPIAGAPPVAAPNPTATSADLVRAAFAAPDVRTAVPPLLRSFAAALGTELINALPLATLNPLADVLGPMMVSGVTSVGAVLARTPDSLYETVLGRTAAADLSNLLTSAEAKPMEIADAVVAALKAAASHHALISSDDLATADARAALAEPLAASLHLPVDTVVAAITAALA